MSLLQEIQNFPKQLNKKYRRKDMEQIVEEYCQEKAKLPMEEMANYVMECDRERFNEGITILNSGHIFSGIMNDPNCYKQFEDWLNKKYLRLNN